MDNFQKDGIVTKQLAGKITPRLLPYKTVLHLRREASLYETPFSSDDFLEAVLEWQTGEADNNDLFDALIYVYRECEKNNPGLLYDVCRLFEFGCHKYQEESWKNPGVPVVHMLHAAWRHMAQAEQGRVNFERALEHTISVSHWASCAWQVICAADHILNERKELIAEQKAIFVYR